MFELIVVSFQNRRRATEAFATLWRMNDDWLVAIDDAVTVHRDRRGNLQYEQSFASTLDKGVVRAGLWCSLLGALIAVPFTRGVSAGVGVATVAAGALAGGSIGIAAGVLSTASDAAWWKGHIGISDRFVREIGNDIRPGDSAILAWIDLVDLELLAEHFRGLGGTVLTTTLPLEQAKKFAAVLQNSI
jgi:uncharacterized membrane protein